MLSGKHKLNQQPDTSTYLWEWLTIYNLRIPSAGRTEQGDVTCHSSAPGARGGLCRAGVTPQAPLAIDPPPTLPLSRQVTVDTWSLSSWAVPPDTPFGHHVQTWVVQSQPHVLPSEGSYRSLLQMPPPSREEGARLLLLLLFVIVAHMKTMSDITNTPKEQEVDVHPRTLHENSQQHEL